MSSIEQELIKYAGAGAPTAVKTGGGGLRTDMDEARVGGGGRGQIRRINRPARQTAAAAPSAPNKRNKKKATFAGTAPSAVAVSEYPDDRDRVGWWKSMTSSAGGTSAAASSRQHLQQQQLFDPSAAADVSSTVRAMKSAFLNSFAVALGGGDQVPLDYQDALTEKMADGFFPDTLWIKNAHFMAAAVAWLYNTYNADLTDTATDLTFIGDALITRGLSDFVDQIPTTDSITTTENKANVLVYAIWLLYAYSGETFGGDFMTPVSIARQSLAIRSPPGKLPWPLGSDEALISAYLKLLHGDEANVVVSRSLQETEDTYTSDVSGIKAIAWKPTGGTYPFSAAVDASLLRRVEEDAFFEATGDDSSDIAITVKKSTELFILEGSSSGCVVELFRTLTPLSTDMLIMLVEPTSTRASRDNFMIDPDRFIFGDTGVPRETFLETKLVHGGQLAVVGKTHSDISGDMLAKCLMSPSDIMSAYEEYRSPIIIITTASTGEDAAKIFSDEGCVLKATSSTLAARIDGIAYKRSDGIPDGGVRNIRGTMTLPSPLPASGFYLASIVNPLLAAYFTLDERVKTFTEKLQEVRFRWTPGRVTHRPGDYFVISNTPTELTFSAETSESLAAMHKAIRSAARYYAETHADTAEQIFTVAASAAAGTAATGTVGGRQNPQARARQAAAAALSRRQQARAAATGAAAASAAGNLRSMTTFNTKIEDLKAHGNIPTTGSSQCGNCRRQPVVVGSDDVAAFEQAGYKTVSFASKAFSCFDTKDKFPAVVNEEFPCCFGRDYSVKVRQKAIAGAPAGNFIITKSYAAVPAGRYGSVPAAFSDAMKTRLMVFLPATDPESFAEKGVAISKNNVDTVEFFRVEQQRRSPTTGVAVAADGSMRLLSPLTGNPDKNGSVVVDFYAEFATGRFEQIVMKPFAAGAKFMRKLPGVSREHFLVDLDALTAETRIQNSAAAAPSGVIMPSRPKQQQQEPPVPARVPMPVDTFSLAAARGGFTVGNKIAILLTQILVNARAFQRSGSFEEFWNRTVAVVSSPGGGMTLALSHMPVCSFLHKRQDTTEKVVEEAVRVIPNIRTTAAGVGGEPTRLAIPSAKLANALKDFVAYTVDFRGAPPSQTVLGNGVFFQVPSDFMVKECSVFMTYSDIVRSAFITRQKVEFKKNRQRK